MAGDQVVDLYGDVTATPLRLSATSQSMVLNGDRPAGQGTDRPIAAGRRSCPPWRRVHYWVAGCTERMHVNLSRAQSH